jgi:hypothetical protein
MKKLGKRTFGLWVFRLCILGIALSAMAGCYYPGYQEDSSYSAGDKDIEVSPPSVTFYKDDPNIPIYLQGYPYYSYYPYYPYYPPDYGNPFYRYYH